MKKNILALILALALCLGLTACAGKTETTTLKVAASSTPHAEILAQVKDTLAKQGIDLVVTEYGDYIVGRMGAPDKENHVFVISVIVKATNEIVSAITGKLGRIDSVTVKSAVTTVEV